MNIEVLSLILFGAFFLLLATGMPMAWVLGGIGMVFTIIILGPTSLVQVALCTWDTMMNFVLIAIALFIFLGFILQESGLAKALYKSMYTRWPRRWHNPCLYPYCRYGRNNRSRYCHRFNHSYA